MRVYVERNSRITIITLHHTIDPFSLSGRRAILKTSREAMLAIQSIMSVNIAERITDANILTVNNIKAGMAKGIVRIRKAASVGSRARIMMRGTPNTKSNRNSIGPIKPMKRRAKSRSTKINITRIVKPPIHLRNLKNLAKHFASTIY